MNLVEMVPCEYGVTVVLTTPEGEVTCEHMTWEEFERLRERLEYLGSRPDEG